MSETFTSDLKMLGWNQPHAHRDEACIDAQVLPCGLNVSGMVVEIENAVWRPPSILLT